MGTSQNTKFRRHTVLHSKNLAYIYSHMRRCDFSLAPCLAYNQPLGCRYLAA